MAAYSVGTWCCEAHSYTPQIGVEKSLNLTLQELRAALKRLRQLGYSAHRLRSERGDHEDNDYSTLVERTDGMTEAEILKLWRR